MSKKVTTVSKCSKCAVTVSKQDMKSHQCVVIKSEIESADDGENIEFLESDYEVFDDSSADELTDLLTSDWTESEVELLLDVSIRILETGERIDSSSFWTKLMADFNKNERWPLFLVKAKLRQLREMFQNESQSLPKQILKKLVKIIALQKQNSLPVKGRVSSTSDLKKERSGRSRDSCSEDEGDYDTIRWTGREIIQLIESYKRHLNAMIATSANKEKRKIWEKIAGEVEMSGVRGCDPYAARMKMMNLKKTWTKHSEGDGRTSWPYFTLMNQVMHLEKRQLKTDLDSDPEFEASSDEDGSELSNKRFKGVSDEPDWFLRFRQEARRRHAEKMKIKLKLLDVLENFVDKMNK